MSKGDTVRLSQLRKNDCGSLKGRRFIVAEWYNGDRVSDVAVILFEDGTEQNMSTDHDVQNPEVVYLGKGKVTIDFPKDEEPQNGTLSAVDAPTALRDYEFITLCEPHVIVLPDGTESLRLPSGTKLVLVGEGVGLRYAKGSAA